MRNRLFLELFALVVAIVGVWGILVYVIDGSESSSFTLISDEKAKEFSKAIVKQVTRNHPEIKTAVVRGAVDKIQKRLVDSIEKTENKYKIVVVKGEMVNAFTLPGGYVIIFSGLLKTIESAEELAAIVAHEIGHTELNHVIQRLIKTIGIQVVGTVLTGGDTVLLSEVAKILASTVFDRHQEREADKFAMDLMVKAQLNPRVLATFFRRLSERGKDYTDELEIFSSHPGNDARRKAALEYELPKDIKFKKFRINWRRVKNAL